MKWYLKIINKKESTKWQKENNSFYPNCFKTTLFPNLNIKSPHFFTSPTVGLGLCNLIYKSDKLEPNNPLQIGFKLGHSYGLNYNKAGSSYLGHPLKLGLNHVPLLSPPHLRFLVLIF